MAIPDNILLMNFSNIGPVIFPATSLQVVGSCEMEWKDNFPWELLSQKNNFSLTFDSVQLYIYQYVCVTCVSVLCVC